MFSFIKEYLKYLFIFEKYLGKRIYYILVCVLFAGLSETFGVLMIIPLLQAITGANENNDLSGFSLYLMKIIDNLGISQRVDYFLIISALGFLLKGLLFLCALIITGYLTAELLGTLKIKLFESYNKIKYSSYLERDSGHIVNLINEQSNKAIDSVKFLIQTGTQIVTAILYLSFSAIVSFNFFIIIIISLFILAFAFSYMRNYIKINSLNISYGNSNLSKFIIQSIEAMKYLRSTAQENYSKNNISYSLNKIVSSTKKIYYAQSVVIASKEPIVMILVFSIIYYENVIKGNLIAPLFVSIILLYRSINCLLSIEGIWSMCLEGIGSILLIDEELNKKDFQFEEKGYSKLISFKKGIKFQNVFFKYENRINNVLNGITLEIPYKSTIGLVGESGSGKSTIVDLITLCHQPTEGDILIENINSSDLNKESWRRKIGYVTQENILFNTTIANNISMQNIDPEKDKNIMNQVYKVALQSKVIDFVKKLPQGFSTLVGDRGIRLSGGQKQRICIARELFRKPDLLIFDEATSSLDTKSEREIQKSIDAIKGKTTIIIISHRLSTLRKVDNLFLIADGIIKEEGNYNSLISKENSLLNSILNSSKK